jgi:hypothetical protein
MQPHQMLTEIPKKMPELIPMQRCQASAQEIMWSDLWPLNRAQKIHAKNLSQPTGRHPEQ